MAASEMPIPEIFASFALPGLTNALLLAFRSNDLKADRISKIIESNPGALDWLRRRHRALRGVEETAVPVPEAELPDAQWLLVQLGMESARNQLIAWQLGREPTYAPRAEQRAARILGEVPALAYAAGLAFDVLAGSGTGADGGSYGATMFDQGLRAAEVASALGRRLPRLHLRRYLFAGALLEALGRALGERAAGDWARHEQRCEQKGLSRPLREFAAERRYGFRASQLSALACRQLGFFRCLERPLLAADRPFLLRSAPEPEYQLAAVLRLASNMSLRPGHVDQEDDPKLDEWAGLELRELRLPRAEIATVSRLMARV